MSKNLKSVDKKLKNITVLGELTNALEYGLGGFTFLDSGHYSSGVKFNECILIDGDNMAKDFQRKFSDFITYEHSDDTQKHTMESYNIHTPAFGIPGDTLGVLSILPGEKIVLKALASNRGVGKLPTTKKKVIDMLYHRLAKDLSLEDFYEHLAPGVVGRGMIRGKQEETKLKDNFPYNVIYEEYVSIEKEYRVTAFKDGDIKNFIIHKRNGYSLNIENYDDLSEESVDHTEIPMELLESISKLINDSKFITLAFDVYLDINDTWGAFEYSPSYALDPYTVKETIQIKKEIKRIVKKKYKLKQKNK